MMTKEDRCRLALGYHRQHYNCGQGLGSGLGSGMRCGGICGAVSGGVLVLGLLHPYTAQEGPEGRRRSVEQVKEFQRRFTQQFHLLNCRELLAERGLHRLGGGAAV